LNGVPVCNTAGLATARARVREGLRRGQLRALAGWPRVDRHGITAVELRLVLAVVAVLWLTVYPLLTNVRQVLMVKGAPEQMAGAIRLARQFAITQGTNHCIEFRAVPDTQYQIRQADTSPACNGTVVDGYAWQSLTDAYSGSVVTTAPPLIFDPIDDRTLPAGPGRPPFDVDTVPSFCLSVVTVTFYGSIRVAGC
jgi:hypothetical protein